MSCIKVFWFKLREGHGNFGDELNPYIIERLSRKKVVLSETWSGTRYNALKTIVHKTIVQQKFNDFFKYPEWNVIFNHKIIFGIGSIISCSNENVVVWGSGIINENDNIPEAKFLAVRGKYTQKRIQQLGMKAPEVLGDPALLLPLVFKTESEQKYEVGLIPHYIHYEALKKKYAGSQIKVINLLDPIEKVITDICGCKLTLSTSLHGIIVSHAYSVRSLWVRFSEIAEIKLGGDNIKFADYFSSVNLEEYLPIEITDEKQLIMRAHQLVNSNKELSLPKKSDISVLQETLLRIAPFPVKINIF